MALNYIGEFEMLLTKGIIKADILASRRAIEDFEETRIRDIKNIAAYHLQQAAEKLINLQIYSIPIGRGLEVISAPSLGPHRTCHFHGIRRSI